ncbi:hypothetical protein BDA96_05G064500 [Sorghum bicolor]|uniref:Uncharacterized protein n=1 Tax=Sorghum bicolor TaxID=4558 RepID=A0A921UEV1_SORBI|nr:hypothetical protein BDA96_05G064500 [Sorghum bicolor]
MEVQDIPRSQALGKCDNRLFLPSLAHWWERAVEQRMARDREMWMQLYTANQMVAPCNQAKRNFSEPNNR